jgi:hypothetical protein
MTVPQPHGKQYTQEPHEYSSVSEFLKSESLDNVNATVNTDANGDRVVTARIRLADNPDEASIDISAVDHAEMERLRDADPFMYHSIVRERRRSSLLGLDEDEQADDEAVQNIEFDLREMDLPAGGARRSSLRGSLRRGGLRGSLQSFEGGLESSLQSFDDPRNVSDSDFSADGSQNSGNNSGGSNSGGRSNGVRGHSRPVLRRRQSSLYNVDEESEGPIDPADSSGGVLPPVHRPFAQSFTQQGRAPGQAQRRHSYLSQSSVGTGSSIVQRKRRFSTEAHSSLIMANLEASLMGSMLSDSPDLDSLFDNDGDSDGSSDSDDDLLNFLRDE